MDNEEMIPTERELRMLIEDSKVLMEENRSLMKENRSLVSEGKATFAKMKKTLNGMLLVAVPILATFFYSYVDNRERMAKIESTRMTDEVLYEKFATKQRVVFLQNDLLDLSTSIFKQNDWTVNEDIEKKYNKILRSFTGDVSRGGS